MNPFRRRGLLLLPLAALLAVAGSAAAQPFSETLFSEMRWRMIGPFRGGRTVAASGVPGNTNVFYVAANNGGVWKTTDAGRDVDADLRRPAHGLDRRPRRRAVAPRHASTSAAARACSGPTSPSATASTSRPTRGRRGRISASRRPADRGRSSSTRATRTAFSSAVLGHPYGPNDERGLFRSTDGGQTWEKVLYKDENTGASAVTLDPSNPDIVYAVLWDARQGPWENGEWQGPESGLFKSTDGGTTWKKLTKGLPTFAEGLGRIGVRVAPVDPKRVYATVDATPEKARHLPVGRRRRELARARTAKRASGGAASDFAEVQRRIRRTATTVCAANIVDLQVDRRRQDVRAREGRAGRRRLPHDLDQPGEPRHDPPRRRPGRDRSPSTAARRGAAGTTSRRRSSTTSPPTTASRTGSTAGSRRAARSRREPRRRRRDHVPRLASRRRRGVRLRRARSARPGHRVRREAHALPPLARARCRTSRPRRVRGSVPVPAHGAGPLLARRPARPLLRGRTSLFKTPNGGEKLGRRSARTSRARRRRFRSRSASTAKPEMAKQPRRGVIYTVAPVEQGRERDLGRHRRRPHPPHRATAGRRGPNVTPPGLTAWSKVSLIDASPFDDHTAYAAVNRIRLDDLRPHVYRTHDGGKTWKEIVNGPSRTTPSTRSARIPSGRACSSPARSARSTSRSTTARTGSRCGSTCRRRRSATWSFTATTSSSGTHGRGFWILDDITPLRQLDATSCLDARRSSSRRRPRSACAEAATPTRRCRPTSPPARTRRTARSSTTSSPRSPRRP